MDIDLVSLREKAKLTQSELAHRMGVTQSQISRWEKSPGDMPVSVLKKYLSAVGASQILLSTEHSVAPPLNAGTPYLELHQQINLILSYLDYAASPLPDDIDQSFTPMAFQNEIKRMRRKPTISFAGRFDSGKSRIANALLGKEILPERYTPHTYIPICVRHINDRPECIPDTVVILDANFDLGKWDDEEQIKKYKVTDGNYRTLQDWGVRGDRRVRGKGLMYEREYVAMVFVDSPILNACNILDTPGFSNDERDLQISDRAARVSEILIYTSMAKGFMDGTDVARIPGLIRSAPIPELTDPAFPTLGNIIFVATQADPSIKDEAIPEILRKGADRLYEELKETVFEERMRLTSRTIDANVLLGRFASFWTEIPERRQTFERLLKTSLRHDFPHLFKLGISGRVKEFKDQAHAYFAERIRAYQVMIENLDQARTEFQAIKDNEGDFQKKTSEMRDDIRAFIGESEANNNQEIQELYERIINEKSVEQLIKENYPEKKDAREFAVPRLMERLTSGVNKILESSGRQLAGRIEEFLGEYNRAAGEIGVGEVATRVSIPFNSVGAFAGGMVGLAGVGALALWASTLGNLGAYILVSKSVSILAAMGISISGGSAAAVTTIAAIGGPATLAIGLVVLLGVAGWALLGPSWETRLARKIVETFNEKNVQGSLHTKKHEYWAQTRDSFEKGCENLETEFTAHKARFEDLLKDEALTVEKANDAMTLFRKIRDFFDNMPWRDE